MPARVLAARWWPAARRRRPSCAGGEKGSAATARAAPRPALDRFDSARAWRDLRAQLALGPLPAGSPASRRLAARLRARLPHGRFEAVPGGLRNVVGTLPGRRPAIVIGAHYDTKDLPGFVGANDGAAGTAAVLEVARALARGQRRARPSCASSSSTARRSPRGSPDSAFLRDALRGSKAYAAAHAKEIGALILLDYVGNRDLSASRARATPTRRCGAACVSPPGGSGVGSASSRRHVDRCSTTTTPVHPAGRARDRPDRLRIPRAPPPVRRHSRRLGPQPRRRRRGRCVVVF